uniref:Uncharacterized protein n=1 Tax=Octopus bimaculoides TaxID=37653 RepID=A0A0L8GXG9_OCTBM
MLKSKIFRAIVVNLFSEAHDNYEKWHQATWVGQTKYFPLSLYLCRFYWCFAYTVLYL